VSDAGEQLIRDLWDRWNAGERGFGDAVVDPDLEIRSALTANVHRGRDGMRQWFEEIDEQFDSWENRLGELRRTEADEYVARGVIHARGRHSGLDLEQPVEWRIQLRDGRIWRLQSVLLTRSEGAGD
jgi:ketosteroid isomerase-like protein